MTNIDSLYFSRLKIVLFTIFFNIIAVIVFANASWSDWRTGMALNLLDNAIFVAYIWDRDDRVMPRLILFGLVLGFTELLADAWLVDYTRTLDYSVGGGPMIWRSPLWMPFAWEVVAIQFAVLGEWLARKFKGLGIFLAGLVGAVNIPFYEEMALKTKWWVYHNCPMFLHTPYYIIFGEFLIVMLIVVLVRKFNMQNSLQAALAGFLGGLGIFFCYKVAFLIFKSHKMMLMSY